MTQILKSSLDFVDKLSKNNNRDWFNANKDSYLKEHEQIISFADELLTAMNQHDNIETLSGKKALHRIYRDTRFSKDKTPYKNHWSGGFKRATPQLRGGYYFHIAPGNSFAAGGFWGPNSDDLKRIREEIALSGEDFRDVFEERNFKSLFGNLRGEQLKSAPKGYAKDHQEIELLRYKQFLVKRDFTDKEVMSASFLSELNNTFIGMRPFFDLMSDILTTNSNGESTLK